MANEPKTFNEMTPHERNEAVARALGWVDIATAFVYIDECGDRCMTHGIDTEECEKWPCGIAPKFYVPQPIPDWQGDDGLAFEELWPLLAVNKNLLLGTGESWIPYNCAVLEITEADGNTEITVEYFAQADTWAHAICKAFLALKGAL